MKYDSVRASSAFMFMEVQRIHAKERTMLKVVNPEYFEQFINFVLGHPKINKKYKLIICLELCSGSRISEILSLKKKDIIIKGDSMALNIAVKKKRRDEERMLYRMGAVPPRVGVLLRQWIFSLQDDELLFNINSNKVWFQLRAMFDICPHALRHSFIIYCFEKKGMKIEEIVNKMLFSNWTIALRYYNTRIDKGAFDMFKEMA